MNYVLPQIKFVRMECFQNGGNKAKQINNKKIRQNAKILSVTSRAKKVPIMITFCQECDTGLWQFKNVSQCCVAFMINYSIAFVEKNLSVSEFGNIIEFLETTR